MFAVTEGCKLILSQFNEITAEIFTQLVRLIKRFYTNVAIYELFYIVIRIAYKMPRFKTADRNCEPSPVLPFIPLLISTLTT